MKCQIEQNDAVYYLSEYLIHLKYLCKIEYKFAKKEVKL